MNPLRSPILLGATCEFPFSPPAFLQDRIGVQRRAATACGDTSTPGIRGKISGESIKVLKFLKWLFNTLTFTFTQIHTFEVAAGPLLV